MAENKQIPEDWKNIIARLERREGGADDTKPAWTYDDFLAAAKDIFVAKSTDYDDRYIKGLIRLDARTIWTWEVEKKLDRLRSWIKRGELQVKDEGIRNSVDDLFIYTVQYYAYVQRVINFEQDPVLFLRELRNDRQHFFYWYASTHSVEEWLEFLETRGLIKQDELLLKNLIRVYMGSYVSVADWQEAIRKILS